MNVNDLEKFCRKIVKLVKFENNSVRCNYLAMIKAEWASWKKDNNQQLDAFFGFQLQHNYHCLIQDELGSVFNKKKIRLDFEGCSGGF